MSVGGCLGRIAGGGVLLCALAAGGNANAAPACLEKHELSQGNRAKGQLRQARVGLAECAADESCPSVVREECWASLQVVTASLAVVTFRGIDDREVEQEDLTITIAGASTEQHRLPTPLELDPGSYRVELRTQDGRKTAATINLVAGDRRQFTLTFPAAPRPPASMQKQERPRVPLATWLLAGNGVAAGAAFVALAYDGREREQRMRSTCAPGCAAREIAAMRNRYLLADISLGVSLLSFGLATYVYVSRERSAAPSEGLTLAVGQNGARAGWSGSF